MPKRKAPTKNLNEGDKEEKELAPQTKQTKKTKAIEKEEKIVKVEKIVKETTRSSRSKSRAEKGEASDEKKVTKATKKTKKEKIEEEKISEPEEKDDKDEKEEKEETSTKGKRGRPKKVKSEDKEEEKKDIKKKGKNKEEERDEKKDEEGKSDEEEKEETNGETKEKKKVVKKTKVVKETETEIVEKPKNGKKLTRNRSDIEDALDGVTLVERPIELGDGIIPGNEIVISSWNVNGLNALLNKDHLHKYMEEKKPDILCINEHKLTDDNVLQKGTKWIPEGYYAYFNCCKVKKGYSGVAIVSKHKPISVKYDLGIKKHDLEGRTITAEFEHFYLVSCYVPNAGDDLGGLPYRTEQWDPDFRNYLNELRKKKHVILCGDLNCAHKEIDIHNPKTNLKTAGFTPQERKTFGELLDSGFVDTFRHFYPEEQKFSYFSIRFNNRATNKGWRLDYFLVDKEGLPSIKDSIINDKIYGSDHLPIELVLNPQFS